MFFLRYLEPHVLNAVCMSPLCQPFSATHLAVGFNKEDGRSMIGLGDWQQLFHQVSVMEEVDALLEASSYSIFLEVVRWAGCRIVARKCVNLGDLLLQNWNRPVKMGS